MILEEMLRSSEAPLTSMRSLDFLHKQACRLWSNVIQWEVLLSNIAVNSCLTMEHLKWSLTEAAEF